MEINVIDLFAGPGGLGEGFSAFRPDKRKNEFPFRIRMSVEKEASAHKTLTTRAFYRALKREGDAQHYFDYIEEKISFDDLCKMHPEVWAEVKDETLGRPTELGEDNETIHARLKALRKAHSGPWIVIGGPPCQAYSLAGRSRNKGVKGYKAEEDPRNFLYREYLKVLEKAQPHVFVMENVKGLLTAKVGKKLIFPDLVRDLEDPTFALSGKKGKTHYRIHSFVADRESDLLEDDSLAPRDFIIKAENYGVPQARHRVILLGVRSDITGLPAILKEKPRVPIESIINNLPKLRSRLTKETDSPGTWKKAILSEAARIHEDVASNTSKAFATFLLKRASQVGTYPVETHSYGRHGKSIPKSAGDELKKWILNDAPSVLMNHDARGHMRADLARYLFSACWSEFFDESTAKSKHFPSSLRPDHKNWETGDFSDRFRVQIKGRPATTIMSHISKDGHYFIHYDAEQCRSLTVREAARIQTFPDNYFFEGNRTEQYVQVGNAVPPYLSLQLANIVHSLLPER